MSRGEAMKTQPTFEKSGWGDEASDMLADLAEGPFSLLPGSDWYDFGGVAIQADPCGECLGGGTATRFRSASDFAASFAGEIIGEEVPCSKCHGLGVIPRYGRLEWRCECAHGDLDPGNFLADHFEADPGKPLCSNRNGACGHTVVILRVSEQDRPFSGVFPYASRGLLPSEVVKVPIEGDE